MKRIDWHPPRDRTRITTIDAHAAGEPFRVVVDGVPEIAVPEIAGATILDRRRFARQRLDTVRRTLMWEPRGHADMYGCFVTPPVTPGADLGVLFLHNEGFSTMCGHGVIALVTVALETGLVERGAGDETTVRIDTPAGLITARARFEGTRVASVAFRNVASFVLALDEEVDVPELGHLRYDLAFGGAFYAYVRAGDLDLALTPGEFRTLIDRGKAVKRAVMASRAVEHPFEDDLGFLYGVIFVGEASAPEVHSRNVCVFADGEVDRSPTGTGVSGRLAIHHARGEIGVGERVTVESLIGTRFTGRVVETLGFGPYDAVIPEIEGTAHITGRHEFLIDPADPLREGFLLR